MRKPKAINQPKFSLRLRSVSKTFDARDIALQKVSFSLEPATFTALVGPSGSGKSTLMRTITGLVTPDSGQVTVLGQELTDLSKEQIRQLRSRVGFIFQNFGLVGRLTALENVLMGTLGSLRFPRLGLRSYGRELRLEAFQQLKKVEMAEFAFRRVDTLSGGQQQRVAIARALLQKPEILLADEPVASLDPANSEAVLRIIRKISREESITALVSLHQIEYAKNFSDRLIALDKGRVILDAPTKSVALSKLKSLYGKKQG